MKLLYPEIDTWVYNTQKTDPSINTLPVSITRRCWGWPGLCSPSTESCHHIWKGPKCCLLVPLWEVRLICRFPFQSLSFGRGHWTRLPATSSQRTDYSPSLHALSKTFSTLQLPPVHNTSHPKLFPLEYFHLFKHRSFLVCSHYMATLHPNPVGSSLSLSLLTALLCWELGAQLHQGVRMLSGRNHFY